MLVFKLLILKNQTIFQSLIRNGDIMLSMLRVNLKQRKIGENVKRLEAARRNLALFQHHDAITG